MKILLTEFYPSKGHRNLFVHTYKLLSKNHEVDVFQPLDCDGQIPSGGSLPVGYFTPQNNSIGGKIDFILYTLRIMKFISKRMHKVHYDCCICITYYGITFPIGRMFFRNNDKLILLHNINVDELENSKIKRLLFSIYKKKIGHLVLSGFMAKRLIDHYNINPNQVSVLVHPMNLVHNGGPLFYDCVGLSNSNDDNMIHQIIEREKKEGIAKKLGLHIVLKSTKEEFDDENLKVITGFIDQNSYDGYISGAKSLFMPFPSYFRYRMSGTLVDALSNEKPVITSRIKLTEEVKKAYPKSICMYEGGDFFQLVQSINQQSELQKMEFIKFSKYHSDENLYSLFDKAIIRIVYNKSIEYDIDF